MTEQLLDIATTTGLFVVVSVGLLLVLGIMGVVNLAHGAFMTIGAYACVVATNLGWTPWAALLIAPSIGFVLGLAVERLLIRRLYNRPLDTILATWGLAIVIIQVVAGTFGRSAQFANAPLNGAAIEVFGGFVAQYRLFCVALAVVMVLLLYAVGRATNVGLIARAVIMDPELARALGINTTLANSLCFGVGSALAAFAGACVAPLASVDPNLGTGWNITAFMVVLLGGISLAGLALSALLLAAGQVLAIIHLAPVFGGIVLVAIPIIVMRLLPDGLTSLDMFSLWRNALPRGRRHRPS
jgi:urea transport system permease protein